MANEKNNKDKHAAQANLSMGGDDFDFSKFMPEGYSANDLKIIGGLTPIYAAEQALAQGFPPVVGFLDRIEVLPEVKQGAKTYVPLMIRVKVTAATRGIIGKKDTIDVVDIEPGQDVLVPISGNLRSNKVLLGAIPGGRSKIGLTEAQVKAIHEPLWKNGCGLVEILPFDMGKVFLAVFRVKGTLDVGQVQDMYEFDVRLHPKTQDRATFMNGKFALPEGAIAIGALPQTASGALYDANTGEIVGQAAGQAAQA